jgi:hypothetical protein
MKKPPHHDSSNASIVILVLFVLAALGQCDAPDRPHTPEDSCGGPGSHPVTIGGAMVIACH